VKGTLYVVATPIGNLKDITFNALEILKSVDYIAAEDTRISMHLLNHFDIKNKLISYHKFNEKVQSNKIISLLEQGKNIALVTDAGTPCISDPGSILVHEATKDNIDVVGISGPCALITALSVSGFDTKNFTFYGFLSRENKEITKELEIIKSDYSNVAVIYESPKRIIKTLIKMNDYFSNSNICLCNDLTKKFEKIYRGTLEEVIKELESNKNSH
jgi:16S rRNA (cytidine1402-2'-O)-methyltransferase